jgi:hypothetical protein
MYLKLIVPILLLSIYLLSCTKDSPALNNTDNPNDTLGKYLIPLKEGNSWNYLYYYYDDNGNLQGTTNWSDNIASTIPYNGNTYYEARWNLRNVDTNTVEVKRDNGRIEVFFKRVFADSTVIYADTLSNIDNTIRKLVAYTTPVNILGYSCIKNEVVFTTMGVTVEKNVTYIKPGIGIVRYEFYYGDTNLVDRFDLVSYSLK